MTSKEKKKRVGHWKMSIHNYYKARCPKYSALRFTDQMYICEWLYMENELRKRTQEEFDRLFIDYMRVNGYMEIDPNMEVIYV